MWPSVDGGRVLEGDQDHRNLHFTLRDAPLLGAGSFLRMRVIQRCYAQRCCAAVHFVGNDAAAEVPPVGITSSPTQQT